MSSELVKELRAATMGFDWSDLPDDFCIPAIPLLREAADRIEALEAEVARLLEALIEIECRPEKMIWGEDTEVYRAMRDMEDIARRAREGGNTDG